jgi:uncharacterized cupin superfamily protein
VRKINVFGAGEGGRVDVSHAVGAAGTAMYIYDLAPGRSSCPYHYECQDA